MSKSLAPGFLEAILENPDDDAPRLIYADWLEDTGDGARAEFIRIQCERARLPEWDARWLVLGWRERELLDRYDAAWRSGLPRIRGVEWGDFRRGFLATLTVDTVNTLAASAEALFDAAPVDQVTLREELTRANMRRVPIIPRLRGLSAGHVDDLAAFAAWPVLSTLKTLELPRTYLDGPGLLCLAESVHLRELTTLLLEVRHTEPRDIEAVAQRAQWHNLMRLALRGVRSREYESVSPLGPDGATVLARAEFLATLKSFDLSGNEIGRRGVLAILNSPHLSGLEEFNLNDNNLRAGGAEAFAETRSSMKLQWLHLSRNMIGERGLAAVASSTVLDVIARLDLEYCDVREKAMRALGRNVSLAELRVLNLGHNNLGSRGVSALAEAVGKWPMLHTLGLAHNDMDAQAGGLLAGSEGLKNLLSLDLTGNRLGTPGVRDLAGSPNLGRLRELLLGDNKFGSSAVKALAEADHLKELRRLVLGLNRFGDKGIAALAISESLRGLRMLELRGVKAGNKGLAAFATGDWPDLRHLDLRGNSVGAEGLRALVAANLARNLRRLILDDNPLLSEGAKTLAGSAALKGLWHLGVNGCGIDPEGMEALARSPHLNNLKTVSLGGNSWRRETWTLLQNRFGEHIW